MNDFNQSGRHGLWGLLENAILEQTTLEKRRVSVFAGPVLTDDDVPYRGTLVPKAYWKVLVYVLDAELSASAFVLQQKVDPGPTIDLGEFAPYQVDLLDLEDRTSSRTPRSRRCPRRRAGCRAAGFWSRSTTSTGDRSCRTRTTEEASVSETTTRSAASYDVAAVRAHFPALA